ncbi:MAG TPA: hypothetical protein P5081_15935 [Phycisphaerae bacterium]|nr:hypothetical protein [Phycisphaerae bacterium]
MNPTEIRAQIAAFENAYAYDAGYQTAVLDAAPEAYAHFAAARAMISHRQHLPPDAHYVARIAMMRSDDCGACAQLNLRMAIEAGLDRDLLRRLLDAPETLPPHLIDICKHAADVARNAPPCPERTQRLRDHYGPAGFAELAVCLTGCRIFPTLKRAMDMNRACEKLTLESAR